MKNVMTKKEHGNMQIELFLPGGRARKDAVIIEKLPHGPNIITIVMGTEDTTDCDALITESGAFPLGIKTADCAPICFTDGKKIGIAHIGWRGLCDGLVEKMLGNFDAKMLSVYVAPFLHSFEIKKDECYDRITQKFGERFITNEEGKLTFHFKKAISSLLPPQAEYDPRGTGTDFAFPSYRRDKTSERFVTLVSFR